MRFLRQYFSLPQSRHDPQETFSNATVLVPILHMNIAPKQVCLKTFAVLHPTHVLHLLRIQPFYAVRPVTAAAQYRPSPAILLHRMSPCIRITNSKQQLLQCHCLSVEMSAVHLVIPAIQKGIVRRIRINQRRRVYHLRRAQSPALQRQVQPRR